MKWYEILVVQFMHIFYMQGKDGPLGQYGIPGVKGDKVKITVLCQINHKCFTSKKLMTQHYCVNLSNLSPKHLRGG